MRRRPATDDIQAADGRAVHAVSPVDVLPRHWVAIVEEVAKQVGLADCDVGWSIEIGAERTTRWPLAVQLLGDAIRGRRTNVACAVQ